MRMFLALEPSPAALRAAETAVRPVREQYPHLRWSPSQNWHVTLVFLGELTEQQQAELVQRTPAALRAHSPLSLAVTGAGTFPRSAAQARVLWLGLEGDTSALAGLVETLRGTARAIGIPVEHRAFHAHLTVARTRHPTDLRVANDTLAPLSGPRWTATEVQLLHSSPGPAGPHYRSVAQWELT